MLKFSPSEISAELYLAQNPGTNVAKCAVFAQNPGMLCCRGQPSQLLCFATISRKRAPPPPMADTSPVSSSRPRSWRPHITIWQHWEILEPLAKGFDQSPRVPGMCATCQPILVDIIVVHHHHHHHHSAPRHPFSPSVAQINFQCDLLLSAPLPSDLSPE